MTSAVVDSGGSVLELPSNGVENQEGGDKVPEFPAVIVEPVPSARLEQGYAAQVLVYDDETYMMQDVAEEQEVETENSETGILVLWCQGSEPGPPACGANAHHGAAPPPMLIFSEFGCHFPDLIAF